MRFSSSTSSLLLLSLLVMIGTDTLRVQSAPIGDGSNSSSPFALDFLRLLNEERTGAGLAAVCVDPTLVTASQNHATYLTANKLFSHTEEPGRPHFTGVSLADRAQAAQFPGGSLSENILQGCKSGDVQCALKLWRESPPHRENMMAKDMVSFGIGNVDETWVMMMGERSGERLSGCVTPA